MKPPSFFGVSPRRQAEFNAIAEFIAYHSPGVASFAQYPLRDDRAGIGPAGSFSSGLCPANIAPDAIYAGGAAAVGCRPALDSFRAPLVVRAHGRCLERTRGACSARKPGARVQIWGHVRPVSSPTEVAIRYRDRRGSAHLLRTLTTDGAGYFSFRAKNHLHRKWCLTWNGLSGPFVRPYAF